MRCFAKTVNEQNGHRKHTVQIVSKNFLIWIQAKVCRISQRTSDLGNEFEEMKHYLTFKRETAFQESVKELTRNIHQLHNALNKYQQE